MRTILFYAKNFGAHFFYHFMIWLYDLVIAAVNTVKWIFQTSEHWFLISAIEACEQEKLQMQWNDVCKLYQHYNDDKLIETNDK